MGKRLRRTRDNEGCNETLSNLCSCNSISTTASIGEHTYLILTELGYSRMPLFSNGNYFKHGVIYEFM
jgi:hypothetical protein